MFCSKIPLEAEVLFKLCNNEQTENYYLDNYLKEHPILFISFEFEMLYIRLITILLSNVRGTRWLDQSLIMIRKKDENPLIQSMVIKNINSEKELTLYEWV